MLYWLCPQGGAVLALVLLGLPSPQLLKGLVLPSQLRNGMTGIRTSSPSHHIAKISREEVRAGVVRKEGRKTAQATNHLAFKIWLAFGYQPETAVLCEGTCPSCLFISHYYCSFFFLRCGIMRLILVLLLLLPKCWDYKLVLPCNRHTMH